MVGVVLTLACLGMLVRSGLRPMAAASAYRNAAWRLGLDADTRGLSVQGFLEGRNLYLGQVVTPTSDHPTGTVRGVLELAVPMGLGLRIQSHRRSWRRQRQEQEGTGDGEFDQRLTVRAINEERANLLLTEPVRECLRALASRTTQVDVSDHWIRVQLARPFTSDHALLSLIEDLRRTADALEQARLDLPCPPQLEDGVAAWASLAKRLGLELYPHIPAIDGTFEGYEVRIHSSLGPSGFRADLRLAFPTHRTLGLRIEVQDGPDGFWSVGQDIQFGDQRFDEAYVIKGYDPAAIRATLGPEARAAILDISSGTMVVRDPYIEVLDLPTDPATLEQVLRQTVVVARAIRWPV